MQLWYSCALALQSRACTCNLQCKSLEADSSPSAKINALGGSLLVILVRASVRLHVICTVPTILYTLAVMQAMHVNQHTQEVNNTNDVGNTLHTNYTQSGARKSEGTTCISVPGSHTLLGSANTHNIMYSCKTVESWEKVRSFNSEASCMKVLPLYYGNIFKLQYV